MLSGLLLIDKPSGPTSHDVVDHVRRVLGIRAVGHAGTLDPFASGLLVLGIEKGTKALTALVGLDKTYEIEGCLGIQTDTFDREGKPVGRPYEGAPPTLEALLDVLPLFRGTIEQRAPLYSALKRQGKKLYELARAGVATEDMRPSRSVTIHQLTLVSYTWPNVVLCAHVSSGTYIRSLVDDIGHTLGTGAYVAELRRTAIGSYAVAEALPEAGLTKNQILDNMRVL